MPSEPRRTTTQNYVLFISSWPCLVSVGPTRAAAFSHNGKTRCGNSRRKHGGSGAAAFSDVGFLLFLHFGLVYRIDMNGYLGINYHELFVHGHVLNPTGLSASCWSYRIFFASWLLGYLRNSMVLITTFMVWSRR